MGMPNFAQYSMGARKRGMSHQAGSAEQHNTCIETNKPNKIEPTVFVARMLRKAPFFLAMTRYAPSRLASTGISRIKAFPIK